jgi:hypothetical protein
LWCSKSAHNGIVPLQIKFLELTGIEKKALHESKAKDITLYGTSLPRLLRRPGPGLPPPGLRAAIATTGPGARACFNFLNFLNNRCKRFLASSNETSYPIGVAAEAPGSSSVAAAAA